MYETQTTATTKRRKKKSNLTMCSYKPNGRRSILRNNKILQSKRFNLIRKMIVSNEFVCNFAIV